jgi:acetaldehyde dehydrogenase (acetylating)
MADVASMFPKSGARFICDLPGNTEWRIMPFTGQDGKKRMIVINPDHPPYVIQDGVATLLLFGDAVNAENARSF